jgi:D-alanyl-D-alanine endopeptidase (penicillin-binding protein 7)
MNIDCVTRNPGYPIQPDWRTRWRGTMQIMKRLLVSGCLSLLFFAGPGMAADTRALLAKQEAGTASQAVKASRWSKLNPNKLQLRSDAVLVLDRNGAEVYARHVNDPRPIASITKLMTAMVILDSGLDLQERITITKDDRDLIQLTGSRLRQGAVLTRKQLLQLALMSSANRAANALARTWPGGKAAFVAAMNKKAAALGMRASHFRDPAGLDPGNVASARDAARMVRAATAYPLIRHATTTRSASVRPWKRRGELRFVNTNPLVRKGNWDIQLSKTGYINESGRCLVMQAEVDDQPLTIVLLDSFGKLTPYGDSSRIRKWIESASDL